MRPVRQHLPLAALAALSLAFGVGYGIETERWHPSPELDQALARLEAVPREVGDWKSTDLPFEPEEFTRAGIKGTVFRRYQNGRSGAVVSVLLVCGRGGPISVHTPDVCYAGAGYRAIGDQEKRVVAAGPGGEAATFKALRFAKPDAVVPTQLEIYWAWSRGGEFESPDEARFSFGRAPALYKLYVVRECGPNARAAKDNACEEFLRRALPEFRRALAGPAGG